MLTVILWITLTHKAKHNSEKGKYNTIRIYDGLPFYIDLTAVVVKSSNFTESAKFYTSTNLSHLNTELYYQEDQLLTWYKIQKSPWSKITGFDYFGPFGFLECLGWRRCWKVILY